jgi:putative ABC transport system ATP-binding protein
MTAIAVAVANLVKVFGEGETAVRALDGVGVEFGAGRFTAIMGPSGSGKSTLMHCAAGLDPVTSGSVRLLDGTELTRLPDRALTRLRRARIGFIFQSFNLLPTLTAGQNITLPLELAGRHADPQWYEHLVDVLGLAGRLGHLPAQLSGGQQQRVACARALLPRPDVVFADEPTGNLDHRTGHELLEFLRGSCRSRPWTRSAPSPASPAPRGATRPGCRCSTGTAGCSTTPTSPGTGSLPAPIRGCARTTWSMAGSRAAAARRQWTCGPRSARSTTG